MIYLNKNRKIQSTLSSCGPQSLPPITPSTPPNLSHPSHPFCESSPQTSSRSPTTWHTPSVPHAFLHPSHDSTPYFISDIPSCDPTLTLHSQMGLVSFDQHLFGLPLLGHLCLSLSSSSSPTWASPCLPIFSTKQGEARRRRIVLLFQSGTLP